MERDSRDITQRTHPLLLGVFIFLASELMLFGAMITAYFNLRASANVWPPPDVTLDTTEATVGSVLLALSSATMVFATSSLARRRLGFARLGLGGSIVLGTAFLLMTVHGWTDNTFRIDSNAYGSIFYMMTGIHAMHVLVGILLMLGLFFNLRASAFQRDERAGAEGIALYWHFVFGVWILIYGSIYLVR